MKISLNWLRDWVETGDDVPALAHALTMAGLEIEGIAAAGPQLPGVVEVAGTRHTADHVVIATGASPFVPPVPGLRELDGVWTNREVTGMKAVPRRLLVLGNGPVGVEMAQAVRRLGGEVVLTAGDHRVLPREPARVGSPSGKPVMSMIPASPCRTAS